MRPTLYGGTMGQMGGKIQRFRTGGNNNAVRSWIRFLIDAGEYEPAGRVESVRLILEKKRLSRTMSLDFTVMALKEGIVFEHLFGDIW